MYDIAGETSLFSSSRKLIFKVCCEFENARALCEPKQGAVNCQARASHCLRDERSLPLLQPQPELPGAAASHDVTALLASELTR